MNIVINDDFCWVCGKKFGSGGLLRTTHHTLPKHLNPKKNILVPVHQKCHEEINKNDTVGLSRFVLKLKKEVSKLTKQMEVLSRYVNELNEVQIKDIIKKKK